MGAAAEVYADVPDQLEYVLGYVPAHARLPVVHLNRGVNVLHERGRSAVSDFADRFAGRVAGVVVHDHHEIEAQTDRLLAGMRELNSRPLGRLGKQLHFHLHDGHPMIPGLPDHFSFLTRLPIPFSYQGRQSLSPMYGPDGLAAIVSAVVEALPAQAASFTVEVHHVEGRLPLGDAAGLFRHWRDTSNAERMNYWLSVLSDNAMLISKKAIDSSRTARCHDAPHG